MAIKYTEDQLNSVNKSMLIQMFLNRQEQLEKVSADLHSLGKGQILRSTPNTAPLICGACNIQPEGLLTTA